ncbi:MAG: hypothetical protein RLZZ15_4654 [Verrucomicrobiota bacterium]|jgi:uncharacterized RDD family membrane protein YckC
MFTIIGGDGKEYGPVTAEQIRGWIAGGRANLDTKAKADGTNEWRALREFTDFGGAAGGPPMLPSFPLAATTTSVHAPAAELAGRGERLGAHILDNLIALACATPAAVMLGTACRRAMTQGNFEDALSRIEPRTVIMSVLALLALMVPLVGVQLWQLTTRGQTLGKRIVGVRIVRLSDGSNPGFVTTVLLRTCVPALIGGVPWIGIIFSLVDVCMIFGEERRCLHDLIAGTKVVNA